MKVIVQEADGVPQIITPISDETASSLVAEGVPLAPCSQGEGHDDSQCSLAGVDPADYVPAICAHEPSSSGEGYGVGRSHLMLVRAKSVTPADRRRAVRDMQPGALALGTIMNRSAGRA